jgi:hypothetical protein
MEEMKVGYIVDEFTHTRNRTRKPLAIALWGQGGGEETVGAI